MKQSLDIYCPYCQYSRFFLWGVCSEINEPTSIGPPPPDRTVLGCSSPKQHREKTVILSRLSLLSNQKQFIVQHKSITEICSLDAGKSIFMPTIPPQSKVRGRIHTSNTTTGADNYTITLLSYLTYSSSRLPLHFPPARSPFWFAGQGEVSFCSSLNRKLYSGDDEIIIIIIILMGSLDSAGDLLRLIGPGLFAPRWALAPFITLHSVERSTKTTSLFPNVMSQPARVDAPSNIWVHPSECQESM